MNKLKKTFEIEIENELPIINKAGFFISLIGICLLLICMVIFLIGYYLPLEIKIVYYFELINDNFYIFFITTTLLALLGIKLLKKRKYEMSKLYVFDDKIVFKISQDKIELLNSKIHKLIPVKTSLKDKRKINIKTIGLKKYMVRMSDSVYSECIGLYPEK